MAFARHENGTQADLRALLSQVHPVFMLPPVASAVFGGAAAGIVTGEALLVHVVAIFLAVYTAHVKDGYVDYYIRGEDEDHPLTAQGCKLALIGSTTGFIILLGVLYVMAGPVAVLLTAPTWILGYLHAPQFDTNPVTATLDYPSGIALAILGGYYIQAGTLSLTAVGFAVVFLLILSGVSIIDDEQDYQYDRSINKRTVSVILGPQPGREFAQLLIALGLIGILWGAVSGIFPPSAPVAAIAFGAIAVVATRFEPELATMVLVRGAYVLLGLLFVSVVLQPLSAVTLPDITILGSYTYLATEVVFGAIAFILLYRANALRSAAKTIIVLYPVAYIWDWYTLEVGVFDIIKRTGIDLFGIPIEEHIFMIVVPALVLGFHETLRNTKTAKTADKQSERSENS